MASTADAAVAGGSFDFEAGVSSGHQSVGRKKWAMHGVVTVVLGMGAGIMAFLALAPNYRANFGFEAKHHGAVDHSLVHKFHMPAPIVAARKHAYTAADARPTARTDPRCCAPAGYPGAFLQQQDKFQASAGFVEVRPARIDRLELPVYGSEHLLQFRRMATAEDESVVKLLPVLLRYRDGELLEKIGRGTEPPPDFLLGLEVNARSELFEAATRRSLGGPFAIMKLANGYNSLTEAVLGFLDANGWVPRYVEIGAVGGKARYQEDGQDVAFRDAGAFTEPAPTSVRVGELTTTLFCEASDGNDELALPLDGPGEGLLFAHYYAGDLPLRVTMATWEQRAVTESRLPQFVVSSGTEFAWPGQQPMMVAGATPQQAMMAAPPMSQAQIAGNPSNAEFSQAATITSLASSVLNFQCPPGSGPGDVVQVPLPDGTQRQVIIPQGVSAGQIFSVQV